MPRVLAIGDGGCKTGFGRVSKGVLDYLYDTGRWDVALRGINFRQNHRIPYSYEVLPITTHRGEDPFGFAALKTHIQEVQPDVICMIQDLWNLGLYATEKPTDLPAVAYFPVDTPNVKAGWALSLGAFSEAVAYTRFGAHESAAAVRRAVDLIAVDAKRQNHGRDTQATWVTAPFGRTSIPCRLDRLARWQNPSSWNVIPHGLDRSLFAQVDKGDARKVFGLPQSAFLIGFVSTNQFRKRQDLALRALAVLRRTIPDAVMVFHCTGGDSQGWDLVQLADHLGVSDGVVLVHHQLPHLTDEQLCLLYNTFDVHINTAGGEGWGLCSFEAAACGVPQCVPAWSSTKELWQDAAVLLPIANWRYEPRMLNTAHCEIDVQQTAELLADIATDHAYREKLGRLALERVERQFSWDRVGQAFEQLLLRALREPTARPMSVNDVVLQRSGEVQSELWQLPTIEEYRQRYGTGLVQPPK